MSASITSVAASPTTVAPGGASTITPVISNPDATATVTVQLDGSSGTAPVTLHEGLTFTVDQTKVGVKGYVVGKVDAGGTLAVAQNGTSFIFTAS